MKTYTIYKSITLLIPLIMAFSTLHGQAYFLEKGQSAFSLGGHINTAEDFYSVGASGVYTIDGTFDLGMLIGYAHEDEDDLDAGGYVVRPFIGLQLLEQSDDIPFNLTAYAAYEYAQLQSELIEDIGIEHDFNLSGFDIGAHLSYQIEAGEILIQPFIGIRYISANIELDISDPSLCFNYGICDGEEDDSGIGFGLGVPFIFEAGDNYFTLSPSLSFYDGNSSFNIGLQYVIPN